MSSLRARRRANQVDAIIFKGAVLDPMDCLEQMGAGELPVTANNRQWYMLSKLGIKHAPWIRQLLTSWRRWVKCGGIMKAEGGAAKRKDPIGGWFRCSRFRFLPAFLISAHKFILLYLVVLFSHVAQVYRGKP
jgi:hypothetical protein